MPPDPSALTRNQPTRFLLLYALASAGGFVAYVPFLTLLLPVKMAAAAGDARIEWLATATLLGAIAASVGNVGFGWASDVTRSRSPWIAAGLVVTIMTYAVMHAVSSPPMIVAAMVAWQLALNMLLSPLAALAADQVPDRQKGLLGGLLGAGPPVGALAGVVVTLSAFDSEAGQIGLICGLVATMVVPVLVFGNMGGRIVAQMPPPQAAERRLRRIDLALMWVARLLVQIAGSTLFGFLFYYFQSLPGEPVSSATVARASGATLIAAVPLALIIGRASDRLGARRPFLIGTAIVMTIGLAVMAGASRLPVAITGYALFGCGCAIFLALHSVYAMQMLPSARHRGRDLGLFNLTNTIPSVLSPLLALTLVPRHGFGGLMLVMAGLVVAAAILTAMVRRDRMETA